MALASNPGKLNLTLFLGVCTGLALGYLTLIGPGYGIDWEDFRLWTLNEPVKQGVWNPAFGKLLLIPLAWLPLIAGHFFINLITLAALGIAQRCRLLPLFTAWTLSELWYGNLDGLVILGLVISRLSNPYLVGVGLFLISLKPQFLPLAIYALYRAKNIRVIVIPLVMFILSLLVLGNWLPGWLALLPPTPKAEVNISLYPWSLPLWLLLPWAKDKERFIFAATALTMPYFNGMSLIALFAFLWPTWITVGFIGGSWLEANTLIAIGVLVYSLVTSGEDVL